MSPESFNHRILYPLTSAVVGIVAVSFGIVTFYLIKQIRFDHNWIIEPTKWTKISAVSSAICYTIGYFCVMIDYIVFAINGPNPQSILGIIAVIALVFALLSFHSYLLNRVNFHINHYQEVINYDCCCMNKLHHIVVVLLTIYFIVFTLFGFLELDIFGQNNTIKTIDVTLLIMALLTDLIISIVLLIIYIKSLHQIAIKLYFRNDYKWDLINDKQHELMIKAARMMVIQCFYILGTVLLYLWAAIIFFAEADNLKNPWQLRERVLFRIGHFVTWSLIILRDVFTISALYFGFEFGHPRYEKCCYCKECMQRYCHNLIQHQNRRYKRKQMNRREYDSEYVEMDIILKANEETDSMTNNLILWCFCCPIEVDIVAQRRCKTEKKTTDSKSEYERMEKYTMILESEQEEKENIINIDEVINGNRKYSRDKPKITDKATY